MKKSVFLALALAVVSLVFCGCAAKKEIPKDLPPLPLPKEGPVGAGGGGAMEPDAAPRQPAAGGGGNAPAGAKPMDPTTAPPTDRQKNVPAKGKQPPSSGKEF